MAVASLCMLSSQTSLEVSQNGCNTRATELQLDDPRLPELQAKEHAEHARMAISHRRKQMSGKVFAKSKLDSSEDRARMIDINAVHLAEKVRGINAINVRKRKREAYRLRSRKRQRLYTKSTRYFLSCFVLGHPWMVVRHIHKSGRGINRTRKRSL